MRGKARRFSKISVVTFLVGNKSIAIVGAGHLGLAVIDALYTKGHRNIIATRKNEQKLLELAKKYAGITTTFENTVAAQKAQIILLTVKPALLENVCTEMRLYLCNKLVVSLAAARSIAGIEAILPYSRIARVMTGIFVSDEIAAYTMGSRCSEEDTVAIKYIFGSESSEVAEAFLADRTWIACDTGLLARGIEEKIKALGIPLAQARLMYAATLQGISRHLQEGETGEEIYRQVAGKGSFTEGLHTHLEQEGYYRLQEDCIARTITACRQK